MDALDYILENWRIDTDNDDGSFDDAVAELARLRSELAEALEVIRTVVASDDFQNECGCPLCGLDGGHSLDCRLAALLKKPEAE